MRRAILSLISIFLFIGYLLAVEAAQRVIRPGTPHAWALATTAILTERNNQSHNLLGGCERTEERVAHWKKILLDWWDISDRDGLLSALKWIKNGGHRSQFEKLGAYIASLTDEQQSMLLLQLGNDEQAKHQVVICRQYYLKFGSKSLLGWDYARYVTLCRHGYLVGFLTESEAWDRIIPAAILLQKTFNSWKDLGENYLVGREFWSYELTQKEGRWYRDYYHKLLSDPNSPWNLNLWKLRLY